MSTETQNNAPVSAELGAKVDAIVRTVREMAQEKPTSVNAYGLSTWTKAEKLITDLVKSYSAPVAAPAFTGLRLVGSLAGALALTLAVLLRGRHARLVAFGGFGAVGARARAEQAHHEYERGDRSA